MSSLLSIAQSLRAIDAPKTMVLVSQGMVADNRFSEAGMFALEAAEQGFLVPLAPGLAYGG